MRLILTTLIVISMLGLLAYTNPTLDHFEEYLHQSIIEETKKSSDPLEQMFGGLLGGLASGFVARQTVRKDFVFFSTYDTQLDKDHLRVIGVLKNFFVLESPGSWEGRKGQNNPQTR